MHRSAENTSEESRHVYTFHIMEAQQTRWSPDNWWDFIRVGWPCDISFIWLHISGKWLSQLTCSQIEMFLINLFNVSFVLMPTSSKLQISTDLFRAALLCFHTTYLDLYMSAFSFVWKISVLSLMQTLWNKMLPSLTCPSYFHLFGPVRLQPTEDLTFPPLYTWRILWHPVLLPKNNQHLWYFHQGKKNLIILFH